MPPAPRSRKPKGESPAGSSGPMPASSATEPEAPRPAAAGNLFGFESSAAHTPTDRPQRPSTAADLEANELPDDLIEPTVIEWTPDRAAALLRGLGYVASKADPVNRLDHPDAGELWRWDAADALEAGEPLARILNRYGPLRQLAGVADEAEVAFTLAPYVLDNLARRGRILAAVKPAEPTGPFEGADPAPVPLTGSPLLESPPPA